jgi:hypothetical protein
MNTYVSAKPFKVALAVLATLTISLSSCDKEADADLIKVSSTPIPGYTPTKPSTNIGDGGVAIGGDNTIIVRLGTTDYTLNNPNDLIKFEVSRMGLLFTGIGAGTDVSEKGFSLISGGTQAGLFDIQIFAAKVNGIEYVASQGDGKVKYTKIDVPDDNNGKKGTVQGTFDVMGTDLNSGAKARIVGSFNITQQ